MIQPGRVRVPAHRTEAGRHPSLRDALAALDWARREMMRQGSPDFLRARFAEQRVQALVAKLLRG
jgi:hypothetical protein